jgi:hypothetical protein
MYNRFSSRLMTPEGKSHSNIPLGSIKCPLSSRLQHQKPWLAIISPLYKYIYIYVDVYIYVYVYIYKFIYIYICAYIYTYENVYMHVYNICIMYM